MRLIGFLFLLLAWLIGLHHLVVAGRWFDLRDVLHHEFFIAFFSGVGVGLILGAQFTKNSRSGTAS